MAEPRAVETQTVARSATITPGRLRQADDIEPEGDDDRRREVLLSTDTPIERRLWDEKIIEILDHGAAAVRMDFINSGRAPLLMDHETRDVVGVIESAALKDRQVRLVTRFGEGVRASEVLVDVDGGIRPNISVGYDIDRAVLEEENAEGPDVYRVTDWRPLEASIVAIPADASAGFGRVHRTLVEDRTMPLTEENKAALSGDVTTVTTVREPSAAELKEARDKAAAEARKGETERIREIEALATRHNMGEFGREQIAAGTSIEAFRGLVLDKIGDSRDLYTPPSQLGLSNKEVRSYSFLRLCRALADEATRTGKAEDIAPFELEVSDAVSSRLGRRPRGAFVPMEWQRQDLPVGEVLQDNRLSELRQKFPDAFRALEKATDTAGGFLVGTDHLGASFIELLRNRMMVRSLGMQVMTGLQGDIQIPGQSAAGTVYWVAEGAGVTPSQQTFRQVTLTPKTAGAITEYTRKLLIQSDPSVDAIVRADLALIMALELDRVGINGSGTGAEPRGILNTSGIGAVVIATDGGPLTWPLVVEHETQVATANADVNTLAYLTNAKVRGKLKVSPKEAGQALYIWDTTMAGVNAGSMNGYAAAVSNQVPSDLTKGSGTALSASIFGDFSSLVMGDWGALDVLTDQVSGGKFESGNVGIRILQDVDLAVRYAVSFSACQEIVTT